MVPEVVISAAVTGVLGLMTLMVKGMMGAFLKQVESINAQQGRIVEKYMEISAQSAEVLAKVSISLDESREDHRRQLEILEKIS